MDDLDSRTEIEHIVNTIETSINGTGLGSASDEFSSVSGVNIELFRRLEEAV